MGKDLIFAMIRNSAMDVAAVKEALHTRCMALEGWAVDEYNGIFCDCALDEISDRWAEEKMPEDLFLQKQREVIWRRAEAIIDEVFGAGSSRVYSEFTLLGVGWIVAGGDSWGECPNGVDELALLALLGINEIAENADTLIAKPAVDALQQQQGWSDTTMLSLLWRFLTTKGLLGAFYAWLSPTDTDGEK